MSLRLEVKARDYDLERLKCGLKSKVVREHPLMGGNQNQANQHAFGGSGNGLGPIKANEENEDGDTQVGQGQGIEDKIKAFDPLADFEDMENPNNQDFESWEGKKLKIFAMFKQLTDGQDIIIDDGRKKQNIEQTIRMGQGKNRADNSHQTMISAKEFTSQLERLDREMTKYWAKEDKVQCIRIAIQCSKLLNDVATPLFYPQKFILLTDILDNFSNLVQSRMRKITKEYSNGRIVITDENESEIDFTQIPDKVREISRNWFNKVSCIREVLPRIYLELAMASSQKYMQRRVHQSDLVRLAKMIRGIAEPLCATYTCAYLARVGYNIDPMQKDYLLIMVEYMFKLYDNIVIKGHKTLPLEQYLLLFEPSIDWLLQCLAYQADRKLFQQIWAVYTNSPKHAIFLKSIIKHFPSEIISVTITIMIVSIRDDFGKPEQIDDQLSLVKELGFTLLRCPPKKSQYKLDFINFGWERMGLTKNPDKYMDCAIVLIEFSIKSLNQSSVQVFIKEIFKRFQDFALSMSSNDTLFKKLEFLLAKVMMTSNDFSELIGFENLLGLLNYFPPGMKEKLCEKMLGFYCSQQDMLSDGFLIHSIFQVAKTLHDKIDFMSEQSEIERVSQIIVKLIKKVDHGKDLEKTLNVYTDARGMFINLDKVTEALIFQVIGLAARCHAIAKGKHTQRTQTFVKACIAYVHITIPTLEDTSKQVQLFKLAAQMALLNGLIGETDSLMKGMLATLDENFSGEYKNLEMITDSVLGALGFLVIVPCNPDDQSIFQIAQGFVQLVKTKDWSQDRHHLLKSRIYGGVIQYLASQQQTKLPYGVPFVNSNDKIFIGNDQFTEEASQLMDFCFAELLECITELNEKKSDHLRELNRLCIFAANILISSCNVSVKKISSYTNKMFKMSDGYLEEFNGQDPARVTEQGGPINRNAINNTFDAFKRKKDGELQDATFRASMKSDA